MLMNASVITILYEYLPKEFIFQSATLNPILFWIQSAESSESHKLNFVKLLTRHLKRFGAATERQSLTLIHVLVQSLSVNHGEFSSWALFCIGQFMDSFLLKNRDILPIVYAKIIEVTSGLKTNESVINNGLGKLGQAGVITINERTGCIQILLSEESSLSLILTGQLSHLLRALLNTDVEKIQSVVLEFLITNMDDDNGHFMHFLIRHSIIEFVFDLMDSNRKLWSRLRICLEITCRNEQVLSTSLIPHAIDRLLMIINDLRSSDHSLMLKYCHLLCNCLQNYSGAVDFFLSSAVQEKQLVLILKLVEDRSCAAFCMGRALFYYILKYSRWIRPLPLTLVLSIVNALLLGSDRHMHIACPERLLRKECESLRKKLISSYKAHFQLLFELFNFLSQLNTEFSVNVEVLTAKVVQLFFGQYLQTFENHLRRIEYLQSVNPLNSENTITLNEYRPGPAKVEEYLVGDRNTLAMLTVNSMAVNGIYLKKGQSLIGNLMKAELSNQNTLYRLVLRGMAFISHECLEKGWQMNFSSLSELLTDDFNHVEFTSVTVTALLIGCVLVNRNIVYMEPKIDEKNETTRGSTVVPSVPEKFLQRIFSFTLNVGCEYFLELPAILIVEIMLTFTALRTSVLSRMNPVVFGPKGLITRAWLVLASALVERLTPIHTYLLIRCPGFVENLQNGDLTWIRMAQSMIFHCHSDESLVELGLATFLQNSYPSLSNVLTVWIATFIEGKDMKLCHQLTNTVIRMLEEVQDLNFVHTMDIDAYQESRKYFAQYATECLSVFPNKLSCSLVEFFGNNVEFQELYVSVLEHTIIPLSQYSTDYAGLLKIVQQVMGILVRISEFQQGTHLRRRLSKVLLNCLINVEEHLFVQIIRIFFSSIQSPGLRHFYHGENQSTKGPQEHCSSYDIQPLELETMLSIGVLVLGAGVVLEPGHIYEEKLKGTIFTDPHFLLVLIRNDLPGLRTDLIRVSSLLCFLLAQENSKIYGQSENSLWPPVTDERFSDFYCSLMLCLQSLIMDPVNQFLRFVAIKVFGLLLHMTCSYQLERNSLGYIFLTSPWNGILVELLQAGVFIDPLPNLTVHFLELLTAFLSTGSPISLVWIEKDILTKLMMVFLHHLGDYPAEIGNSIRALARTLALCSHLDVLSNAEQWAVHMKLNSDPPVEPNLSLLKLFKIFLHETVSI
ncbi:hypothetical protein D915_003075 [Fasciola hepatica]|uniref:Uncharacterized protein n=1 Tax=Fasciola hepatica TaxID=6192 RepID=A0A4E0RE17_FASHE|nr:hypothetical protein D915_003075 [Fasciola hepatica]